MDKLSGKVAEQTREEWRELGFYYISSEEQKTWTLHGSRKGLLNLSRLVKEFASLDLPFGTHKHLMPHWYLTLTSDDNFTVNSRGISGTPRQLNEFAEIFSKRVQQSSLGVSEYISAKILSSDYSIEFMVHGDSFDPSSKDPQL